MEEYEYYETYEDKKEAWLQKLWDESPDWKRKSLWNGGPPIYSPLSELDQKFVDELERERLEQEKQQLEQASKPRMTEDKWCLEHWTNDCAWLSDGKYFHQEQDYHDNSVCAINLREDDILMPAVENHNDQEPFSAPTSPRRTKKVQRRKSKSPAKKHSSNRPPKPIKKEKRRVVSVRLQMQEFEKISGSDEAQDKIALPLNDESPSPTTTGSDYGGSQEALPSPNLESKTSQHDSSFSTGSNKSSSTKSAWADAEHDALYSLIRNFREDEKRRNIDKKNCAKDVKFWSMMSNGMIAQHYFRSPASCKSNWSRFGRAHYHYEERANPPADGSLVSMEQGKRKTTVKKGSKKSSMRIGRKK